MKFDKVMRGGSQKIDVLIDDPSGKNIRLSAATVYDWYDSKSLNLTGDYKICFRNNERFEKQIYINIVGNSKYGTLEKKQKQQEINQTHTYMQVRNF